MSDIEIFSHENKYGEINKIIKIKVKSGFVYMTPGRRFLGGLDIGDPEKVVIVDASKFLNLWQNDPNNSEVNLAFGDESTWRKDYKFHHAERGFSGGIDNPVPLAYLHCYYTDIVLSAGEKFINLISGKKRTPQKVPYCCFSNGITRTIWLLSNGTKYFPVMTDKKSCELLQSQAGVNMPEYAF